MDMESLRILVDLAETKSFSKTAERSFVSQSAVSQRVQALEREFGQTLVERGKGRPGATFTEAGTRLLTGAREILARADALTQEMAELSGEVGGTLRVATVYSIGLHALPPYLSAFLAEYPQVNLHLEYLRTDRIYEALLAGVIDLGIVACPQARPQIEVVPWQEERMALIVPPSHPLGKLDGVPLTQLQGQPFIAFAADIPTRSITDDLLRLRGVSVQIVQAFDNIETIKRVVEIGLGVAIVPEPTVRREVRDGTLLSRPLAGETFTRPTGILLARFPCPATPCADFGDVAKPPPPPIMGVPEGISSRFRYTSPGMEDSSGMPPIVGAEGHSLLPEAHAAHHEPDNVGKQTQGAQTLRRGFLLRRRGAGWVSGRLAFGLQIAYPAPQRAQHGEGGQDVFVAEAHLRPRRSSSACRGPHRADQPLHLDGKRGPAVLVLHQLPLARLGDGLALADQRPKGAGEPRHRPVLYFQGEHDNSDKSRDVRQE